MYNHFDSENARVPPGLITTPGGKCPLYDESNKRKDQQVDAAEKEAMAKVRAEHPELSEEDLRIKFAKSVQQSPRGHRDRHRPPIGWALPPHLLNQHNAIRDHANPFGAAFVPRHANVQADAAAVMPEALPAGFEAQRLQQQQLQQQQQAAYHAYMQLQQQRHVLQQQQQQQAHQQLEQIRVQQQAQQAQRFERLRAQQHELDQRMEQLRARQQARLQQHSQNRNDENQAPNLGNHAPNQENLLRGNMPVRPDGLFDARQPAANYDQLAFNDFDENPFLLGPNQPVLNPLAPRGQVRGEQGAHHPVPQVHTNVQNAARHAQQVRQQQQPQHPRAPTRRNAAGYVDVRNGQGYPFV